MVCKFPNCTKCSYADCVKTEDDIRKMRKSINQRNYRERENSLLPNCDTCEECVNVYCDRGEGTKRLCVASMHLIESRIATSPFWCIKRF